MTSDGSLDSRYLDWLYSQIGPAKNNRNPARSFWLLAEQLHTKRFRWSVPNDDNRNEDGKDLRDVFLALTDAKCSQKWLEQPCSILEMMIALSRRLEFESANDSYSWFWQMIENLSFRIHNDEAYNDDVHFQVDYILNRLIDRSYLPNGDGGLFPLTDPENDQRKIEIWYQMSSYLLENGYE